MSLLSRLHPELVAGLGRQFTIPGTVIPEYIRNVMRARLEEGGSISPWLRRALSGTLPPSAVNGSVR